MLFQETIKTNYLRIVHFLEFSRNYLVKQNPIKVIGQQIIEGLKDFLTMNKKLKLSRYRVNYHRHQLQKMENLIAQNNDHVFLRGNKLNEMR